MEESVLTEDEIDLLEKRKKKKVTPNDTEYFEVIEDE